MRRDLEATGTRIVTVHMGRDAEVAPIYESCGAVDIPRISDPERLIYRAFGLGHGAILQLMNPRVVIRAIGAVFRARGAGAPIGDALQMPGAFVLSDGAVVRSYVYRDQADRPDYVALARP